MKKFTDYPIRAQLGLIVFIVALVLVASEVLILTVFSLSMKEMTIKAFNNNANLIEDATLEYLASGGVKTPEDTQSIERLMLSTIEKSSGAQRFLIEGDRVIVRTKTVDDALESVLLNVINKESEEQVDLKYKGEKYLYLQRKIADTQWTLVSIIPKDEMNQRVIFLIPIIVIVSLFGFAVVAVASLATIKAVTDPVESIVNTLDAFENPEFYEDMSTTGKNEVSEIAAHLNDMIHKIRESNSQLLAANKQVYELELLNVKAELSYYQSQINPHFLYNTLESIRSMATIFQVPEIEALAVSMSKIFRYAVKEETIVTLREELNCVQDYMDIMNIRFPGRYFFRMMIKEERLSEPIVKMILQPLVENCFKHGFVHSRNKGTIAIRIKDTEEASCLEIIDTGVGMSKEVLSQLNQSVLQGSTLSHVGLSNIHKRIKLCFGDKYGVRILSSAGHYTKVCILLPK